MQGQLLDNPALQEIADKYGKTTAQIILRWDFKWRLGHLLCKGSY
ncbi:hypothetical protein BTH41_04506 [Bacillus mycoides]|nr:hypothetical protein BTH41_04506 [Bacillus mycoides]